MRNSFSKGPRKKSDRRGGGNDRNRTGSQGKTARPDRSEGSGDKDRPAPRERSDRPAPRERSERPERREGSGDRDRSASRGRSDRPQRSESGDRDRSSSGSKFPRKDKPAYGDKKSYSDRSTNPAEDHNTRSDGKKRYPADKKKFTRGASAKPGYSGGRKYLKTRPSAAPAELDGNDDGTTRLNKFVANAGICSRREADEFIGAGLVSVNGIVVTQMGVKVGPEDEVRFHDKIISGEKKQYLLLNKPKDYITTMDDPQERRTVMSLIQNACKERVYPVGRLDRATTGVLLFTNDGDLAKRLTHPSHNIRKVYLVELDKALRKPDFDAILDGVELEDGMASVDTLAYAGEGRNKSELMVEIHNGKNRIVRRIFESLGYSIRKLDRTSFAGITKKELMRGKWRFLTEQEVGYLKMQSGKS